MPAIEIGLLTDEFRWVRLIYEPRTYTGFEDTERLLDLVQQWGVFSSRVSDRKQELLLEAILNAHWQKDSGEDLVSAGDEYQDEGTPWDTTAEEEWSDFCEAVASDPDAPFPFREVLADVTSECGKYIDRRQQIWRGRKGAVDNSSPPVPWSGTADIGAHPQAPAQRANPAGKAVLYCAPDLATIVKECEIDNGLLSVASISTARRLHVVDLVRRGGRLDPFGVRNLPYAMAVREILYVVGEQMGRLRDDPNNDDEYRPCQKAAEAIEALGYDGILYPSAAHYGGVNLVIFQPQLGIVGDSALYTVEEGRPTPYGT